jgi:hypothetical protein
LFMYSVKVGNWLNALICWNKSQRYLRKCALNKLVMTFRHMFYILKCAQRNLIDTLLQENRGQILFHSSPTSLCFSLYLLSFNVADYTCYFLMW